MSGSGQPPRSRAFYDAALAPLGLVPYPQPTGDIGYGPSMDPSPIQGFALYIGFEDPSAKRPVVPSAGFHVALKRHRHRAMMNRLPRAHDPTVTVLRLRPSAPDVRERARELFLVMASTFEEPSEPLSDRYLDALFAREDFWALVALADGKVVGGVTAHTLPMTRRETRELFIYDLAVDPAHQRRGIGRRLIAELTSAAAAEGIPVAFVPADNEDTGAIEFYRAIGGMPQPVTFFNFGDP